MAKYKQCEWCGDPLPESTGPGRPSKYCGASHRQLAYQARQQDEAVRRQMSKAGASVASHLLEAERFATMLGDSMQWHDNFTAIKAEHDKAMRAVFGATKVDAVTRSALTDIGHRADALATARAALMPSAAATALATAVDQSSAIQKVLGATRIEASMMSALAGIGERVDALGAALKPNTAAALAAAVDRTNATQKALDAARAHTSDLSALTGIGQRIDSLAALGATLNPGVDQLARILHGQFNGVADALRSHRFDPIGPSQGQVAEAMRRLSMRADLAEVAASAANLIKSVGLSSELASNIQRCARAANRNGLVADLTSPQDLGLLSHDSALHEVVEPSLEEADSSLLLIFVVIAVFPALLANPMAYMTQAVQDLLFMARVLGKLTQVDDAIPGVLLLDAVIRAIRRPRQGP